MPLRLEVQATKLADGTVIIRPGAKVEAKQRGTVREAARITGMSPEWIRLMIRAGRLRATQPGERKYLVDLDHARELAGKTPV